MKKIVKATYNIEENFDKYALIKKCQALFDMLDDNEEVPTEVFSHYDLQHLYDELSDALRALKEMN